MSASRWALSLFLICHLTSIVLASLPPVVRPNAVGPPRHPTDDSIAKVVTPVVDRGARVAASFTASLSMAIRPLRRLTALYIRATGIGQTWNMFSRPFTENRYARLRYYVAPSYASKVQGVRPMWMATELVFPALRADERMHLLRAYRAFARDKAFLSSIEASPRRASSLSELPSDLVPVVRYFANRYRQDYLAPGERIVRTEVWLGTSPIRSRGSRGDPLSNDARRLALTDSYTGPVEQTVRLEDYPPTHAVEMQEDLTWRLEFFEE